MSDSKSGPDESAAKSQNPLSRYSLLGSAQRLEDHAIKLKPLLGRLCLSGEATVWYARYNTGKTLICLHLIIEAVQQGRIAPDDVYYINADDSSAGLAQKVGLMQDHGVHVVAPGWQDFKTSLLLETMEKVVATGTAHGKLIVLDTHKKFVDVMDKKAGRAFNAVVRDYVMQGGTFLALAHTNKRLGPDGKPIPEGTADTLNDFDSGYVLSLSGVVTETGDHIVEFERSKGRGASAFRAQYSYDASPDIDYIERLCSIREIDLDDLDYDPRSCNQLLLLLLTGARVSELLHAEWHHVDLARRAWLIPTSKTGKSRYVPLSQAAIDIIEQLPRFDGCPYLIPNAETRLPFVSIKRAWHTARKAAGLTNLRIHDLRHSAASFMINSGVDLFAVGKVLGHADYKSTMRYSHLANETLLSAVEAGASKLSAQWAS